MVNVVKARAVNVTGSLPGITEKKKRKNPGRTCCPIEHKYGIKIPCNVDAENGDDNFNPWIDAIIKEINSLLKFNCFEFHDPG